MKNKKIFIVAVLAVSFFCMNAGAQDFGFGGWDEDEGGVSTSNFVSPFKISGEVSAEFQVFFDETGSQEKIKNIEPGDIFGGSLDFSVSGSAADAFINFKLIPVFDGSSSPVEIGEAYARVYFGPVTFEAGLRKLSWGRADGIGPLDIVNPLDYRDLSRLSDPQSLKIPRPMLHASWNTGSFSRLEAVFVPWFEGHKFDMAGRWMPAQMIAQMNELQAGIEQTLTQTVVGMVMAGTITPAQALAIQSAMSGVDTTGLIDIESLYPQTNILKYAQAGLRFTTTVGSNDLGFQYYFGRLPRPAYQIDMDMNVFLLSLAAGTPDFSFIDINVDYNYYHQIGVDFARVIAGFNTRAELGANITGDLDGTDGSVYNPALVYSLGFDRDLVYGINLNLQGSGSIMLFHSKMKDNPIDVEAGKEFTSTRITGVLSRKFMRDEVELKAAALWGIEDKDFLIMPSIVWSRNDISAELQAGFFGGDKKGELGQYRDNNYVRALLTYRF